jgi:hypothetical protein
MSNIYKKENTYLVFERGTDQPLRWKSDSKLFFAGSVDDALEGLPYGEFVAIQVSQCSKEIQTEYEQLIDEKIKSGEIEV